MMTQKGRVVYDRKKNIMRPSDIARMLDAYSVDRNGREFGDFVRNVLQLTLDRRPRKLAWLAGFMGMIWVWSGLGVKSENLTESQTKMHEFFMGEVSTGPQIEKKVETQAERKRRLAKR